MYREMHFPAIWRHKFQNLFLQYPPWVYLTEIVNKANSKESLGENGCRQKCLDKNLDFFLLKIYFIFVVGSWDVVFPEKKHLSWIHFNLNFASYSCWWCSFSCYLGIWNAKEFLALAATASCRHYIRNLESSRHFIRVLPWRVASLWQG